MHITEGIITGPPALLYTAAGVTLVGYGINQMKKFVTLYPEKQPLLGMAGALIFFISLLPVPAFTGTCSHPCATPFIAILFGPAIAIALTGGSLLLQAAFFAHGGFGTWGANVVALGLFGCLTGWSVFCLARKMGFSLLVAGFAGGLLGDIMVYIASGFILAGQLAYAPTPQYSFIGYLMVIYAAYLPTQLPIAIGEMAITGFALHYINKQRPEVLADLGLLKSSSALTGKATNLTGFFLILTISLFLVSGNSSIASNGKEVLVKSKDITLLSPSGNGDSFSGMDESVNEKLAEDAGLKPQSPLIDTESMGDLWNSLLLISGGVCGFILGRWWHLISKKRSISENKTGSDLHS